MNSAEPKRFYTLAGYISSARAIEYDNDGSKLFQRRIKLYENIILCNRALGLPDPTARYRWWPMVR
jgi:hypothetical protein